jgi:hypothetical protein
MEHNCGLLVYVLTAPFTIPFSSVNFFYTLGLTLPAHPQKHLDCESQTRNKK